MKTGDTFGQALLAHWRGRRDAAVIERNDGQLDPFRGADYFTVAKVRSSRDCRTLTLARGRVLDIGCGAGRHSLVLQKRGLAVTGIDPSPSAIKVCKERGLKDAREMGIEDLRKFPDRSFDSIIMLGNNFGLFGTLKGVRKTLKVIRRITTPRVRLIIESLDVHDTTNPKHLSYQRKNLARGRLAGQLRLRVRFGRQVGPWFNYLMASPDEIRRILRGTGWRVARIIKSDGPMYTALIVRSQESSGGLAMLASEPVAFRC